MGPPAVGGRGGYRGWVDNIEPRLGVAGWRCAGDGDNCRLPDGLQVAGGHPKAVAPEGLRSDGQVVISSAAAAAFTLPS